MKDVPKSLRLQIGIFGRVNVGKSSFLNLIAGQDAAIVSPHPGTTTDVVEKTMEFRPIGPVVFLDTAGAGDSTELSSARMRRTAGVFRRADVFVVVTVEGQWDEFEENFVNEAKTRGAPVVIVVNKTDEAALSYNFRERLLAVTPYVMACSSVAAGGGLESGYIDTFREIMTACTADIPERPQALIRDLIPRGGLALLVVPIDRGAPKGRLILPQAHAIRDVLDGGGLALTVRESEYETALRSVGMKPDLVVCDSQVVREVAAQTPIGVRCTTFSILFARLKGGLDEAIRGAEIIGKLKSGDRVLIAEACSHHASEDDIGRVKIPRWLRERIGADLEIDHCCGRDYPEKLERYALVIHCGACMLTRREMRSRLKEAADKHVPVTNYGMAIAYLHGVLDRVLEPFGEVNVRRK